MDLAAYVIRGEARRGRGYDVLTLTSMSDSLEERRHVNSLLCLE
jgi:hypothetical protein